MNWADCWSYVVYPRCRLVKGIWSGTEHDQKTEGKKEDLNSGTLPKRPDHDVQVEEFLKEQYRSKGGADMPNLGEDK